MLLYYLITQYRIAQDTSKSALSGSVGDPCCFCWRLVSNYSVHYFLTSFSVLLVFSLSLQRDFPLD